MRGESAGGSKLHHCAGGARRPHHPRSDLATTVRRTPAVLVLSDDADIAVRSHSQPALPRHFPRAGAPARATRCATSHGLVPRSRTGVVLLHPLSAVTPNVEYAGEFGVFHRVDVADLLGAAHLADRGYLFEIVHFDTTPAPVWHSKLIPTSRHDPHDMRMARSGVEIRDVAQKLVYAFSSLGGSRTSARIFATSSRASFCGVATAARTTSIDSYTSRTSIMFTTASTSSPAGVPLA